MADVAGLTVVGGGAAGLAAAVAAGRMGVSVEIREKTDGCGRKLALAGGRKGNFTHAISPREMVGRFDCNPAWLLPLLRRFPWQRITGFFHSLGIDHRVADDGCVWPIRADAAGVRDAMLHDLKKHRGTVRTNSPVRAVSRQTPGWQVSLADGSSLTTHHLLIATGGASYPHTGSSGDGLALARSLGLACRDWFPALASLATRDDLRRLAGITQESVAMAIVVDGRVARAARGHFIFAHSHVSGSSVLNLCGFAARPLAEGRSVVLRCDWVPDETPASLLSAFQQGRRESPRRHIATFLVRYLSRRLADLLLARAGVPGERMLCELARDEADRLIAVLKETNFPVAGTEPIERATATGGGVLLEEVDNVTLEAKRFPGLYFAGEVLDAWGETGGYNLHFAWATGIAAAEAVSGRKFDA